MEVKDKTVKLKVTGMTCGGCVNAVIGALEGIEGVIDATVDLESGEAKVRIGNKGLDPSKLALTVKTAGYGAEVIG